MGRRVSSLREARECNKVEAGLNGSRELCPSGKLTFLTRSAAKARVRAVRGRLREYRCPTCGWFHLTSKGGKLREASTAR